MVLNCFSFARYDAVISQGLEETSFGHERLKYDYKSGLAFIGRRLGRGGKPWNLLNFYRNVTSLPHISYRDFSSEKSNDFSFEDINWEYVKEVT